MKKIALMGTAFAAAVLSSSVAAQSSVTLYGLIEDGVDFYNNSAGRNLLETRDGAFTGIYGSRWGLTGEEDLGGGMSTVFRLENGFNSSTGGLGQGGRMFGRQAYVGLADKSYGSVLLGRQYDEVADYLQFAGSGSQWGGIVTHASDIDNVSNSYRISNVVKYVSPNFHGFTFSGLYAFSNDSSIGGAGTTAAQSAGASYANGPFKVAVAYYYLKHPATYITDGHYVANTVGAAIGAAGPWSYVGNPNSARTVGAGASYLLGKLTFRALYTQARFIDANGTTSNVRFDDYDISLNYALTPSLGVGLAYLYTLGHVDYLGQEPKYNRLAAGVSYKLSARSQIYGVIVGQQAGGAAKGADLYEGTAANMSTTNRQVGGRIAFIHKF